MMGTESTQTKVDAGATAPPPVTAAATQTSVPAPDTDKGKQDGAQSAATQTAGTETKSAPAQDSSKTAPAELKLKFPEAFRDEAANTQFAAMAKELQLSEAQAQKLLDLSASNTAGRAEAAKSAWDKQQKEWVEAVKSDKELGGADFEKNLTVVKKAIVKFGGEGFSKYLDDSGLGNNPDFLRTFLRIGKAISEDSVAGARSPATRSSKEEALRSMYPTHFKE